MGEKKVFRRRHMGLAALVTAGALGCAVPALATAAPTSASATSVKSLGNVEDPPSPGATPTPTPSATGTATDGPTADLDDTGLPSDAQIAAADAAATEGAKQVADLVAQQAAAQSELIAVQSELAQTEAARQKAQERLDAATAATAAMARRVATAQSHLADGIDALADQASIAYQQGADTSKVAFMIASGSPNTLMDLAQAEEATSTRQLFVVRKVSERADALESQRKRLSQLEAEQAAATAKANAAQAAAKRAAESAGAKSATLAAKLESLQAQLAELTNEAKSLREQRVAGLVEQARAQGIQAAAARAAAVGEASRRAALDADMLGAYTPDAEAAQAYAYSQLDEYGWDSSEFGCLVALWNGESGWSWSATNPSSGAYGIPQSLPSYKMASAGDDWLTNPHTQIRWGMTYISDRYGSPCGALAAWQARSPHWY